MPYGLIRAWLDAQPVPDGNWTKMSPIDAMSRIDEIGFMSLAMDLGEPSLTACDVFEILHKAPAIPAVGIGIHERDPYARNVLLNYLQSLFADSPSVKIYTSDDGGNTYLQV
jgi:hypothetical protein